MVTRIYDKLIRERVSGDDRRRTVGSARPLARHLPATRNGPPGHTNEIDWDKRVVLGFIAMHAANASSGRPQRLTVPPTHL